MKKSAVKRFFVLVVIVGIFLTVIGLPLHYSRAGPLMPSFNFLNGRKPVAHIRDNGKMQYSMTQDIYSFEADFNNVFPNANKELLDLGFVDKTRSGSELWHRDYFLLKGPYEQIRVRIYTKHKLSVYSTPASSDYSSPDRHEFHMRDGWISVTVSVEAVKWKIRFLDRLNRIIYSLRP
jgi:hypothetical protein